MADELVLKTGRGDYLLKLAVAPELAGEALVLPLVLEHRGGLERVGLICRVARRRPDALEGSDPETLRELLGRIAARFERDFEQVREAALKSLRAERKPLLINVEEADLKAHRS